MSADQMQGKGDFRELHADVTDVVLSVFGPRPQFKRLVLENQAKSIRVDPRLSAVDSLEAMR